MMKQLVPMLFSLALIFYACSPEWPCDNVKCYNGGVCIDGTCQCPYGASGDSCTVIYDSCALMDCGQNATGCRNATCICREGYEGSRCQTYAGYKFEGNWAVDENCDGTNQSFNTELKFLRIDSARMVIFNFNDAGIGDSLFVRVIQDSIKISGQFINNQLLNARGGINASRDTINLTFTLFSGITGITKSCTATMVKQ
jgi:hypothetical protein